MSSDPLMMDYEGGDLLAGWCCLCRLLGHCQGSVCRLGGERWLGNIIEDCEALRLPLPDADSLAHDRVRWRTLIYNRESGAARAR